MSHYNPEMGTDEEVKTEDGRFKYWRPAVPLPLFARHNLRRAFVCQCAKSFRSQEAYELHYRKAYAEERHQNGGAVIKKDRATQTELNKVSLANLMDLLNLRLNGKVPNRLASELLHWRNSYVDQLTEEQ